MKVKIQIVVLNQNIMTFWIILTEKLEHNYDSWYYNVECGQDSKFDVECSFELAYEYISNYIRTNGNKFYVVFVIK